MSWEERRRQWKNEPPKPEEVGEWFDSLQPDERVDAFLESKSFQILVEQFIQDLKHMQEMVKEHHIFLRYAINPTTVGALLRNVIMQSPRLMEMVQHNENITKYVNGRRSDVARRLFQIFSYPTKAPLEAYNLDQEWESGTRVSLSEGGEEE